MAVVDERKYPEFVSGKVVDTVTHFYWNHIKQNAFWSFCILIPACIVFSYFAYDYIRGGFITRWEVWKIMQVAFFTMLPAGILLNLVLYYHAYNLIINSNNNFSTPYKLGKQFDNYLSKSLGFFFRVSGPFLLFIGVLFYTQKHFNPLVWSFALITASVLYEIACCTYGLKVVASVNDRSRKLRDYRKLRDWSLQSSIDFFKRNKKQIISYTIISMIGSVLLIGIWAMLTKISTLIALIFALFAGSLNIMFRATLHTKLLEHTDLIGSNT